MTTTATQELAVRQHDSYELVPPRAIELAIERHNAMVQLLEKKLLKEGHDYGVIPGTERKGSDERKANDGLPNSKNNTLLKPGAEKLCSFFGLVPEFTDYRVVEDWEKGLFYYAFKCTLLRHGEPVASAIGSCNSREKKYRYRNSDRLCPDCNQPAIRRSKYPPKSDPDAQPGWYCHEKAGGCGANFAVDDPAIIDQQSGRVENNEPFDLINTIQKMAQKRALVGATLIAANASEFFTQDVEDYEPIEGRVVDARDAGDAPREREPQVKTGNASQPDLSRDEVFLAEWDREAVARGFPADSTRRLLEGFLTANNARIETLNPKERRTVLNRLRGGNLDKFKEKLSKPQNASPPNKEPEPQQQSEDSAGSSEPPITDELVKTHLDFLEAAIASAKLRGIAEDKFAVGIGRAVVLLGKKGKEESISKVQRKRWLTGIRDGSFDYESGQINQVEAALA